MAVSTTTTLEGGYGSRVVVKGAGFLLNNEMGDFNKNPGVTLPDGTIGTPANLIDPGKRMLSSMTPTIVSKDGKVVLITGSPGGRTIINTVFNVVLSVTEFGMNVRAAVDAPRMHHQWLPDTVDDRARRRDRRSCVAKLTGDGAHGAGRPTGRETRTRSAWTPRALAWGAGGQAQSRRQGVGRPGPA